MKHIFCLKRRTQRCGSGSSVENSGKPIKLKANANECNALAQAIDKKQILFLVTSGKPRLDYWDGVGTNGPITEGGILLHHVPTGVQDNRRRE